jgi:hypothetical protein
VLATLVFTAALLRYSLPGPPPDVADRRPERTPQDITASADTAAYWQQEVRYTIRALLDERAGAVHGAARLGYRNHSPDTLTEIWFHLYLNAFRPGSRFAADETREGIRRFADLPDPYHGYERLREVRIEGVRVDARYPHSPDSTVAGFALPRPLAPGDSLMVELDWESRLSAIPRRQGRYGRRFDVAQWYPKVAVYDRRGWQAHPPRLAGEFYGEFGTYDVTLDIPRDQVIAATGVVVEGDPGWERARASGTGPVSLQSDWYGDRPAGAAERYPPPPRGYRRVRFYAEDVHDFAFSLNPEFVYEEGRYGETVVRVLYQRRDADEWGGGKVLERAVRSLAWLDTIFGPYAWPQATFAQRIEGGATEFPMLVMSADSFESTILHETGHLYTYGILANDERVEGWLDEGFTTFQATWNFHRRGMGVPLVETQRLVLTRFDLEGRSEPLVQPAEDYAEHEVYRRMVYTKGQLILEMLRYVVGEETFRRGLRAYYGRHRLRHVTSDDLRRAMEDASGLDLRWFFDQWLHRTPLVDYRLGRVRREQSQDGGWRTRVTVERLGDGIMPVDVSLSLGDTTLVVRADGRAPRETLEVVTAERPAYVELDPGRRTLDWNYLNNRKARPLRLLFPLPDVGIEDRVGWADTVPARRDRRVVNWLPLAWYSSAGGVTLGFQSRENYMGRFERVSAQTVWRTGPESSDFFPDGATLVRNPTSLRAPRREVAFGFWQLDGRVGGSLGLRRDLSQNLSFGPRRWREIELSVMSVSQPGFVDPALWADVATAELAIREVRESGAESERSSRLRFSQAFGVTFAPGTGAVGLSGEPLEVGGFYTRFGVDSRHRRRLGAQELRIRIVVAGAGPRRQLPLQRALYVSGADPYQSFWNPFLRSRGALFTRRDVNYHSPGGGNVRGVAGTVAGTWMVGANLELSRQLAARPVGGPLNGAHLAAFLDVAVGDSAGTGSGGGPAGVVADAGVGVRVRHRIGPTRFVTRLDLPLGVSRPSRAVGARPGDGPLELRWVWSLEEAF